MAMFRKLAEGIYSTNMGGDPVRGKTIILEKHWDAPRGRNPIQGQRYWWTFTIAGGETDGIAYASRSSAHLAACLMRDGIAS